MNKPKYALLNKNYIKNIFRICLLNKIRHKVRVLALGFGILALLTLLIHFAEDECDSEVKGWEPNVSRDVSKYIFPQNVTTILNPVSLCSPSPYLLVIICSAVENSQARMALRSTWADKNNLDALYNASVKVAFLLGQSDNSTVNNLIAEESEKYNDVIQERFHDTYNNLTLKSCMLLKWVTLNCSGLKYLMKTDDDMFVNIPRLIETLKSLPKSTEVLLGSLISNARPILDSENKWYTPKYLYAEKTFPNYLSGTGYVMSSDVAANLYQVALNTSLLHLEDVFLTGLCAKRAKIRPVNHSGFRYSPRKMDACALKNCLTVHRISLPNMYSMWAKLQDSSVNCTAFITEQSSLMGRVFGTLHLWDKLFSLLSTCRDESCS